MKVIRHFVLVCVALSAVPAPGQEPWLSRLSARYVHGDGVGYSDGFTSIDWFLPLLPDGDDTMWFADLRAIIANDSEFSSNVGTGYRWYVPEQDRIYGLNVFWDSRQFAEFAFSQAGIGFESLGRCIDFEVNGYTPAVNDTDQRSTAFVGNNLQVYTVNALSGADFLVGYNMPAIHDVHTRILGGGYYFDSNQTKDATGWRVRLEAAFRDWLAISAVAQDDDLYGQNVLLSFELKRPIEHDSDVISTTMRNKFRNSSGGSSDSTVRYRLGSSVRRQQQIVLTEKVEIATDLANMPLTFVHVVPGAAGTGTFENPYGTITDAMADGLAMDSVINTPQGGTFNENVVFTAGAELRSNGPEQVVNAQQGTLSLPGSGLSSDLTMLPATINGDVTLADNTVLNGFSVVGTVSSPAMTMNSVIENNRIRQPMGMDAVTLTDSSGITMNNLLIDQAGARGIGIENSSVDITSVTLNMITGDAIEINNGADDNTVALSMVTVSAAGGEGIDANLTGAGNLDLSIQQSNVASVGNGVSAVSTGGGDLMVAISNTSVGSTAGSGFVVDGSGGAGTTTVTQFDTNTVSAAMTGGALFTDVEFDAVPGGVVDPVLFNSLIIGAAPTRITGDGVSFVDSTGAADLGVASILNTAGAGLFVNNSTGLELSSQAGSTIDTTVGPALDLTGVSTALVFDSVSSLNSPTRAARFDDVDGSLTVTTTTATDAVMAPFQYENIPIVSPFAVSFGNTTINSLQGPTIGDNEDRNLAPGVPATGVIYNPLQIIFP